MKAKVSRRECVLAPAAGLLAVVRGNCVPSSARAAGFLVSGRQLLFSGREVTLRGVAVGDVILSRRGRPASDYRLLADGWRVRLVRLSVHPGLWRSDQRGVLQELRANVQQARQGGIAPIIDWHTIGWPDAQYMRPEPQWHLPDDVYDSSVALARSFWDNLSREFGRRGDVIFELWNEPALLPPRRDPPAYGAQWEQLRPVWVELISIVRQYSDNLVLVTGGTWASDLTGVRSALIADRNTAYSWHVYPGTAGGTADGWARILDNLDAIRPVFVTEWGFSEKPGHYHGTAQAFGKTFSEEFLERRGLHWTAWCWHPSWDPSLVQSDWRTPTPAGELARTLLASRS